MKTRNNQSVDLLFKEEVFRVIGAAMEVHRILGNGFLEPVYQEALKKEFSHQGIPFLAQKPIEIKYKGETLEKSYVADFVVFDKIIVEIKALNALDTNHFSQVLNYLKATGFSLGLLINFGEKSLDWKRIIYQ